MVGNIEMVKAKAEEIARDLARTKALRGDDEDASKKKKGGKEEKKVLSAIRDKTKVEYYLPVPRPTDSSEDIRKSLKDIVDRYHKSDLEKAAKYKADAVIGSIAIGWKFPKEDDINKRYAKWNELYEKQTDLEGVFKDHFIEAAKRAEAIRQEEKREMEG